MKRARRGLSIRTTLIGIAVVGFGYVLSLAIQMTVVIAPTARFLKGRAGELLVEQVAIRARLQDIRANLRDLYAVVRQPENQKPLSSSEADRLEAPIQARLDSVVAMRASIELAGVPAEMRLRLAEAVESETAAGLTLLEAVRDLEFGDRPGALVALDRAQELVDATSFQLHSAQGAAFSDVVHREDRLLKEAGLLNRIALGWAGLGAALLFTAIWLIRRRLYQPLANLQHAVERVERGDLNAQAEVMRQDEVGQLAAHFNTMAAVLRERGAEETRRREGMAERVGRILDESSDEIYAFDGESLRFIQANRRARSNLGYTMDELAELSPLDVLRDLDQEAFIAALQLLRTGEQPSLRFSAGQARKDGSVYPIEMTLQFSKVGNTAAFTAVVEDATDRVQARELNERLRHFALHEHRVISGGDLSAALRAITELAAESLAVDRASVWRHMPGGLRCLDSFDRTLGTHSQDEGIGMPAQGDHVAAQLEAPVLVAGRLVASVICEGDSKPRDWNPGELAFAASVADLVVLAMEAAERHRLQNQLAEAQKMDSIGRLAGGVAHDFNNLLTAILGHSEFAKSSLPLGDPLRDDLEEIEKAGRRAAELTRQLLTFARGTVVQPVVVDINELARNADKLLRRLIGENIELITILDPGLGAVRLDPGQFEQVIVNLAVNARDAMPNGGRLTIRTRNVRSATQAGLVEKPHVELSVTDNGIGMSEETRLQLFEPFFTTKASGRGTGLGLATCYGIVSQAGGTIAAVSAFGGGTTFTVLIPQAAAQAERAVLPEETVPATGGPETVLLVEDEEQIRRLAERVLLRQGYTVLTAMNGEAAYNLARDRMGDIDLVVTDVMLPLLSGPELAARLRLLNPKLPIIYISGYSRGEIPDQELVEDGVTMFLAKPFTPANLAHRVRESLDRKPARVIEVGA